MYEPGKPGQVMQSVRLHPEAVWVGEHLVSFDWEIPQYPKGTRWQQIIYANCQLSGMKEAHDHICQVRFFSAELAPIDLTPWQVKLQPHQMDEIGILYGGAGCLDICLPTAVFDTLYERTTTNQLKSLALLCCIGVSERIKWEKITFWDLFRGPTMGTEIEEVTFRGTVDHFNFETPKILMTVPKSP